MKSRFRLFRRGKVFWCQDNETGIQKSLGTKDETEAKELLRHKNEPFKNLSFCKQLGRMYLEAADPEQATRIWQDVMDEIVSTKSGSTKERWNRAIRDKAFDSIRGLRLTETNSDHFFGVLKVGTVATNFFLRQIQNYALGMDWISRPIIPKKKWLPLRFNEKRAITLEEHLRIIDREENLERRALYELCWYPGWFTVGYGESSS